MFSSYDTNTPPFSHFFSPPLIFCLSPLVFFPQNHPSPAVKAQSVQQAANHVSLPFSVFLRKQVSGLWSGCKTSPAGVSKYFLYTVFCYILENVGPFPWSCCHLINDTLQGKFLISSCVSSYLVCRKKAFLSPPFVRLLKINLFLFQWLHVMWF